MLDHDWIARRGGDFESRRHRESSSEDKYSGGCEIAWSRFGDDKRADRDEI